jgi:YidC/Oxa1 family membrane protein insertase
MMVVIGVMFYKVAAGLCLYFIASSLWGMAERKLLPKRKAAPVAAPPPSSGNGAPVSGKPAKTDGKKKGKKKGKPEKVDDTPMTKVRKMWEEILKQAKKK